MAVEFTQELILPSQGYLNPEIPEGKVIQRCMMVSDQKSLSGSKVSSKDIINTLVQRTITSPEGFDVSKLTPQDTLYLLFKLRVLSYGGHYRFITKCPECGKKIDIIGDLSDLQVEYLDSDYQEGLSVVLPNREDTVYTKVLTNEDNQELDREISRRKKRRPDDESEYVLRISRSIEKVVFKTPVNDKKELTHQLDIEQYVSSLTNLDASAILATRDSVTFGIYPVVDTVCPKCKSDISANIQFSPEFFRPTIFS